MRGLADFFGGLFGKKPGPADRRKVSGAAPVPEPHSDAPPEPSVEEGPFKPGDVIAGKYEVHRAIGRGRLGLVLLVYSRRSTNARVLRGLSGDSLPNRASRKAFAHKVRRWVELEESPFIRVARAVAQTSGWLFVVMNYVAPDDRARVSLMDHLRQARGPLEPDQALEWAIQFCHGMEHAARHGIPCHADIKPHHILIGQDKTVKITDFGFAPGALAASLKGGFPAAGRPEDRDAGFCILRGERGPWGGTAGYLAPELYGGGLANARTDIYSFGVVLWQMAAGNAQSPFLAHAPHSMDPRQCLEAVHQKQTAAPAPPVTGPLASVTARCLAVDPAGRYADFGQLRRELEEILCQRTGRSVRIPETGKETAAFWVNKGNGLDALGRHEKAINCYQKALTLAPRDVGAWSNGGSSFDAQGRFDEAIRCFDKALEIDPNNAAAWNNKGRSLHSLGRWQDAIACFDKALELDPHYAGAWYNKGNCLNILKRYDSAILCFDTALEIDPRIGGAWNYTGGSPDSPGRNEGMKSAIERDLAEHPGDRSADFNELRKALDNTLRERTGKAVQSVDPPEQGEDS